MEEGPNHDPSEVPGDPVEGHRIGHLVAQAAIQGAGGVPYAVLFRCDCGAKVQVSLIKIRRGKFRDACQKCWKKPRKPLRRLPKHPNLRKDYPGEYRVWTRIRRFSRGSWREDFGRFMHDMGPRPSKDHTCVRLDPTQPYYRINCVWGISQITKTNNPFIWRGEQYPPSWVAKKFQVRRSFLMACRKRGIRDVDQILELWEEQGGTNPPGCQP